MYPTSIRAVICSGTNTRTQCRCTRQRRRSERYYILSSNLFFLLHCPSLVTHVLTRPKLSPLLSTCLCFILLFSGTSCPDTQRLSTRCRLKIALYPHPCFALTITYTQVSVPMMSVLRNLAPITITLVSVTAADSVNFG
jgi:hypothetical protein